MMFILKNARAGPIRIQTGPDQATGPTKYCNRKIHWALVGRKLYYPTMTHAPVSYCYTAPKLSDLTQL